jgi:hypothetical protein
VNGQTEWLDGCWENEWVGKQVDGRMNTVKGYTLYSGCWCRESVHESHRLPPETSVFILP